MAVLVGTSGWSYDEWVNVLYPRKASSLERLDAYAQKLRSVEVNRTFYGWPRDEVFASWAERLPEGFVLTAKAARDLTHLQTLKDPGPWLERMESGLVRLEEKRGVLLFQLPPYLGRALDRLDSFLGRVPVGQRVCVEFRHPSWNTEETCSVLSRHGAAYCITSGLNLPCIVRATAGFVYVRLHGPDPHHPYTGAYTEADLCWWAKHLGEFAAQGRDVFVYFNNTKDGHAVSNALRLKELTGG
jgi:uncharacterized protein YecE (DUF72 family)